MRWHTSDVGAQPYIDWLKSVMFASAPSIQLQQRRLQMLNPEEFPWMPFI